MTDSFQNEQKNFVEDYSGELSFSKWLWIAVHPERIRNRKPKDFK